ncbi:MAG TPA: nucleoside triphosphate pyrophosphohydrolase [Thermoanaerobacterales bacterium]|nr:nucleoside triphosphate pyrophosphohydrolase [Thermoanaerobacterales bacterium]
MTHPKIVIVGLGPGSNKHLTLAAARKLKAAKKLFLRTAKYPIIDQIKGLGIDEFESFDYLYEGKPTFEGIYECIADKLLEEAGKHGSIVYAVPGNPLVAETSVELLTEKSRDLGVEIEILPGMSFLDPVFTLLGLNPNKGLLILDALELDKKKIDTNNHCLIVQIYDRFIASNVKLLLLDYYPHDFKVTLIRGAGIDDVEDIHSIPLVELDRNDLIDHLTCLYVPPVLLKDKVRFNLNDLEEIMDILRGENGCPWDLEQTRQSLKPFLLEETYEVLEMLDIENVDGLCDELGDLLLQIVFHARIGKENDEFDLSDVITAISNKMLRRHTHIFGDAKADTPDEVLKNWEKIKMDEKGLNKYTETLKSVPSILPALMRSYKVQEKAASVGFDWERVEDAAKKVFEELDELKDVYKSEDRDKIMEELGDVLFAVVNVARFLNVDLEEALRRSIEKFINRFTYIEESAIKANKDLTELSLEEMDNLWNEIKKIAYKEKK